MSYYIAAAGDLTRKEIDLSDEDWKSICRHALPKRFRYLVSVDDQIVEPVLLYLYQRCVVPAKVQSVGNSQKAYCDDLYEWFCYLAIIDIRWDHVLKSDVVQYREGMLTTKSPLTGTRYKTATIRRRLLTIRAFYRWAFQRRLCDYLGDIDEEVRDTEGSDRSASKQSKSHRESETDDDLIPRDDGSESVDAISATNLIAILRVLGPLPKARTVTQSSRARLAASVAAGTGMRVDEVAALTLADILNLRAMPSQAAVSLKITKTKGLRPRRVFLPIAIYEDLLVYIQNERAQCVKDRPDTTALFVNHAGGNRNPGGAATKHTLWRDFRNAVIGAGLFYEVSIEMEGRITTKRVAQHHFHDLRHTYAVLMYRQLEKRGKPTPWILLSRLLGHKWVSTTVQIYLRSVDGAEADITDILNSYMRAMRDA